MTLSTLALASLTTLDYLTACLAFFTLLLVVATVYMGREMTKTRTLSAQPQLALHITMIGKMVAAPALTNIGAGSALEVDVQLVFVPAGSGVEVSRGWRTRLIVPGERHVFMPPLTERGSAPTFEEFARSYDAVRIDGTFRDRFGREHHISEEASDLAGVQRRGAEAKHLFEEDALGDAAAELRGPLDRIAKAADSLTERQHAARASPAARLRSRVRHLLGIPNVTADGFVADVWWGRKDDVATSAISRSRGSGSVAGCRGGLSSAAVGTSQRLRRRPQPCQNCSCGAPTSMAGAAPSVTTGTGACRRMKYGGTSAARSATV